MAMCLGEDDAVLWEVEAWSHNQNWQAKAGRDCPNHTTYLSICLSIYIYNHCTGLATILIL